MTSVKKCKTKHCVSEIKERWLIISSLHFPFSKTNSKDMFQTEEHLNDKAKSAVPCHLLGHQGKKKEKKTTFKQVSTVNQSRTQYLHFNNDGNLWFPALLKTGKVYRLKEKKENKSRSLCSKLGFNFAWSIKRQKVKMSTQSTYQTDMCTNMCAHNPACTCTYTRAWAPEAN